MTDTLFRMYKRNFPRVVRNETAVRAALTDPANRVFTRADEKGAYAACVVRGGTVVMLCVDEGYRGRGVGSMLLREAEESVAASGFTHVTVGAGEEGEYITPGVPMADGAHMFFARRGYEHAWGDCGCFDMAMDMTDLPADAPAPGDTVDGVTYRFALPDERAAVVSCVREAHAPFAAYYDAPEKYLPDAPERALAAFEDGEARGALLVSRETEAPGTGSVGCTATAPSHRNRHIAGTLVKTGLRALRDAGMTRGFLGYTYTAILSLYGRAGFRPCAEYFMAEKNLAAELALASERDL